MRVIHWVTAVAVVASLLAGCGEGSDAQTATKRPQPPPKQHEEPPRKLRSLEITLDGDPHPQHAGVFLAKHRGYFEDVGLDLSIHTPVLPVKPMFYITEEFVELAISYQPQVILSREEGEPVVAVGSVFPRPTTSLIWLQKSGIKEVADLKGKTIATAGLPYQESLLATILHRAGLGLGDVKILKTGYSLTSALERGRADAAIASSWGVEETELRSQGLEPVVTPVTELGVPSYEELVLIARPDRLKREGDKIRDFMRALRRGTEAAIEDPAAATEAILEENPELQPQAVEEGIEATLPLLSKTGQMDPTRWGRFAGWMQSEGLIDQPPAASLLTDAYLPPG